MPESPDALIEQAQASLAIGDAAAAQANLNQLLQLYPQHPQALFRRGFVRVRLHDLEGALQDWEEACELEPALQRQCDSAEFRPSIEAALQAYTRGISQEPSNLAPQILLARAYAALGRHAQALQTFALVQRVAPEEIDAGLGSAKVYLRLGQGEQALATMQKLYELHPNNADLCWRIGKLYNTLNSAVQATRFFERATTIDPNDWKSHLELGQIFLRQGRHEQATARFQRTLQMKADCAAALVGLAECCKELYRFEAAISYYQQAVAVDPHDYKALCQMGSLCIQLGGLDMGIDTLLQALEINANDVEIHSSLAKAYQQKGDLPTAARYFAKTVEFNPKDYFAAYNLGLIYRSQGQIEEAAVAFGTAAGLRPNDSQYQYQSARSLLDLGRVQEALDAAHKAVSLNPHSKESQLLYGRCCLEAQTYETAAEAFRQAVQIDPQNVEAHYQLAVALLHLDLTEESRNSFQTVLRLSPQHAPSQLGLGHVARRTGQWQTAADHYRQAIQLDLTLRQAVQELIKLYLDRNQRDSISEFIRQLCVTRKGDHRIPAEFLRDWLSTLEGLHQFTLAEEAAEFVLNMYPSSPQARENCREFHLRTARFFVDGQESAAARHHLEAAQRISPQDAATQQLEAELNQLGQPLIEEAPREAAAPLAPTSTFEAEEEPLWAPLDLTPKTRLTSPPPLGDDFFLEPPSVEASPAPPAPAGPPAPVSAETSEPAPRLAPPPALDDLLEPDEPVASAGPAWEPQPISRLALEDISAGRNPEESASDLAQHYLDFALHLEQCGWYKQACLFVTDACNFSSNQPEFLRHQVRILQSWAARLTQEGDGEGAHQLLTWLEGLEMSLNSRVGHSPPVPEPAAPLRGLGAPPELEPELLAPPPLLPSRAEIAPPPVAGGLGLNLPPPPLAESAAVPPRVIEEPSIFASSETDSPFPDPSASPFPEFSAPAGNDSLSIWGSAPTAPSFPLAAPPAVQETPDLFPPSKSPEVPEKVNEIADWMRSLQPEPAPPQEPAPPPPPQPEPEPAVEPAPFRSAEFEVNLSGQETAEQLVQMIQRYPDDKQIRQALFRSYSDDVPGLLKVFRDLSQEDADEPYHVLNLARAYAHTGSDSLAVLQYRKYIKLEPTSEGYRELGEVYERMGKSELASQAHRRAEQLALQEAE